MKAIVKTKRAPGFVEVLEYDKPEPGPDEVCVRVESAGVCGTDVKILHNETWSNPPVILGHEYSGVVESVGGNVSGIEAGDRVVSETAQVVCGACLYCKSGRPLMCKNRLSIGYGVNGAFAEYIVVRKDIIHKIPENVSFDEAAMCEPFAVALHGVWDSAPILPTQTILVMGPGAIGQLAAQAAMAKGATVILAGTPNDRERLAIAEKIGVGHVTTDLSEGFVREATRGAGVDIAVDCTGAQPAIRQAMRLLNPLGKLIQIGLSKPALEIDYGLFTQRELSIIGSFGHRWQNWEDAIHLLAAKKVNILPLATGHYPLEEWEQAFLDMEQQSGIKILLHPFPTCGRDAVAQISP
jgi:L-iditol 2-dehydrogenase